ncbi:hypothetical protein F5I97DRAFT_1003665 [Phlebopus sp. FC_14]|nr:hypothetical protein F5I97DRAFT_1003665 [Phlebopus sp. FC_14]
MDVLRQLWDNVTIYLSSPKLEEFLQRGSRILMVVPSIDIRRISSARCGRVPQNLQEIGVSDVYLVLCSLLTLCPHQGPQNHAPARFAAICGVLPDGRRVSLQCVDRELEEIEGLLPSSSTVFTKFTGSASTRVFADEDGSHEDSLSSPQRICVVTLRREKVPLQGRVMLSACDLHRSFSDGIWTGRPIGTCSITRVLR